MSHIETGVDKLVKLVNSKKKISVNDAAKDLGVSVTVVEEWANFLEEEKIISLEYNLGKTFLVERKLTKIEVDKKERDFVSRKDAFVRKIETTVSSIDKEAESLEKLKDMFVKMKDSIGSELSSVQGELKELEKYEELKKNIDKEMIEQQEKFKDQIRQIDSQIMIEKKKYQEVVDEMDKERGKLKEEEVELTALEKEEAQLRERMKALNDLSDRLSNKIKQEESSTQVTEEHIKKLELLSNAVLKNIEEKKKRMDPLVEESKLKEEKIMQIQDALLKKVIGRKDEIKEYVNEGKKTADNLREFFDKKVEIEKALQTLDKDKNDLKMELGGLAKKAQVFDLASQSTEVKKHIAELEDKFKVVEKKKKVFHDDFHKLGKLFNPDEKPAKPSSKK